MFLFRMIGDTRGRMSPCKFDGSPPPRQPPGPRASPAPASTAHRDSRAGRSRPGPATRVSSLGRGQIGGAAPPQSPPAFHLPGGPGILIPSSGAGNTSTTPCALIRRCGISPRSNSSSAGNLNRRKLSVTNHVDEYTRLTSEPCATRISLIALVRERPDRLPAPRAKAEQRWAAFYAVTSKKS